MSRNSQARRKKKIADKNKKLSVVIANKASESLKIATIFLDESGNTGSNIIDENQPIFTLSGCKFTEQEAVRLIELTGSRSPKEAHFKQLKRKKSGQDGMVRLMKHSLINKNRVQVELFHKKFMVTTKIVDLLIEHMMHLKGQDLYLNGANIALSNMWFYCLPTFCGEEQVLKMYKSFVKMIKFQTDEYIEEFYSDVAKLNDTCSSDDFKSDIAMILSTKSIIQDALDGIEKEALDPSIPALFCQCLNWGDVHPKGFHIIHDDSQTLEKQKSLFAQFMDWTQDTIELGYDRRKFNLPLKGKSLKFSSSEEYIQLQVADIIASSLAYWANGVSKGETVDYFFLELNKLGLDKLTTKNKIWPTLDVTPKSLGTEYDGGVNPADNMAHFLMKAKGNSSETAF
jgi:hypothetical protein